MTASLAASFRALFPLISAVAALAVVGAAVLVWMAGYGLPAALGLLLGGLIALVALFGLVAIQIDNNELLAIIAEAATDPRVAAPAPKPAVAPASAPQRSAAELARMVVGRAPDTAPEPVAQSLPPTPSPTPSPPHLAVARAPLAAAAPLSEPGIPRRAAMPPAPPPGPVRTWGRAEPVLTARRG